MTFKNRLYDVSGNRKGFSLIEILIALAIISVISGLIFSVFSYSNRNYTSQNVSAEVQQKLRSAMELILQDIRAAGLDPVGTGVFGVEQAEAKKLSFTSDSIDIGLGYYNGVIDDENSERMTYVFHNNQIDQTLNEGTASEVTQSLIENVNNLTFTYFDSDGNNLGGSVDADRLKDIRVIEISLTIRNSAGRDEPVSRTLTKRVKCRNLGLS